MGSYFFLLLLLLVATCSGDTGNICSGYVTSDGFYWNLASFSTGWSSNIGKYQYNVNPCGMSGACGYSTTICQDWSSNAIYYVLGYNSGWWVNSANSQYLSVHYTGSSDSCPGSRSTTVIYQCGTGNSSVVTSVSEGPLCAYTLYVTVPRALCYSLNPTTGSTSSTSSTGTTSSNSTGSLTTGGSGSSSNSSTGGLTTGTGFTSTTTSSSNSTGSLTTGGSTTQSSSNSTGSLTSGTSSTGLTSSTTSKSSTGSSSSNSSTGSLTTGSLTSGGSGSSSNSSTSGLTTGGSGSSSNSSTGGLTTGGSGSSSNSSTGGLTTGAITTTGGTPTPSPCNSTSVVPSLYSPLTYFANNTLNFAVQTPVSTPKNTHYISNIVLGSCSSGLNIVQSIQSCTQTFVGHLNWANSASCGFTHEQTSDSVIIHVPVLVTTVRTTVFNGAYFNSSQTDALFIAVSFLTNVSVSTGIQVEAPVDIEATVFQQNFLPGSGKASVQFLTATQWPYSLVPAANSVVSVPYGLTASAPTELSLNCGPTSCQQAFTFEITPTSACSLTGDYTLAFTVVCMSPSLCLGNTTGTIVLSLESSNFCSESQTSSSLSTSLTSYSDAAHHNPAHSFFLNNTGYFLITASSDSPIAWLDISTISIGSNDIIYSPSNGINRGNSVSPVSHNGATISFALFFNPTVFESQVYTITAVVEITYADNSKKRSITSLSSKPGSSSPTALVQLYREHETYKRDAFLQEEGPIEAAEDSAATHTSSCVFATLLISLVFALFL